MLEIESLKVHRPGSLAYIATANEKISILKKGRTQGLTPKVVLVTSVYVLWLMHTYLHLQTCIHTCADYLCTHTGTNWGRMSVVHAHRKLWSLE